MDFLLRYSPKIKIINFFQKEDIYKCSEISCHYDYPISNSLWLKASNACFSFDRYLFGAIYITPTSVSQRMSLIENTALKILLKNLTFVPTFLGKIFLRLAFKNDQKLKNIQKKIINHYKDNSTLEESQLAKIKLIFHTELLDDAQLIKKFSQSNSFTFDMLPIERQRVLASKGNLLDLFTLFNEKLSQEIIDLINKRFQNELVTLKGNADFRPDNFPFKLDWILKDDFLESCYHMFKDVNPFIESLFTDFAKNSVKDQLIAGNYKKSTENLLGLKIDWNWIFEEINVECLITLLKQEWKEGFVGDCVHHCLKINPLPPHIITALNVGIEHQKKDPVPFLQFFYSKFVNSPIDLNWLQNSPSENTHIFLKSIVYSLRMKREARNSILFNTLLRLLIQNPNKSVQQTINFILGSELEYGLYNNPFFCRPDFYTEWNWDFIFTIFEREPNKIALFLAKAWNGGGFAHSAVEEKLVFIWLNKLFDPKNSEIFEASLKFYDIAYYILDHLNLSIKTPPPLLNLTQALSKTIEDNIKIQSKRQGLFEDLLPFNLRNFAISLDYYSGGLEISTLREILTENKPSKDTLRTIVRREETLIRIQSSSSYVCQRCDNDRKSLITKNTGWLKNPGLTYDVFHILFKNESFLDSLTKRELLIIIVLLASCDEHQLKEYLFCTDEVYDNHWATLPKNFPSIYGAVSCKSARATR